MFFLLWGASGSGKTTVMRALAPSLDRVVVHDFDEVGVPPDSDTKWRQRTAEQWVQRGLQAQAQGRHFVLTGQVPFGELLACPSAPSLETVAGCLLDCDDYERIDRIRARPAGNGAANQDMLCWSAWLRMHARDPQWRPDVIVEDASPEMVWSRWQDWTAGDPRWTTTRIDTTGDTLDASCAKVRAAIERALAKPKP